MYFHSFNFMGVLGLYPCFELATFYLLLKIMRRSAAGY